MTIGFSSDNSYLEFLNNIKERSMYNFNENIGANDKAMMQNYGIAGLYLNQQYIAWPQ